MRVLIGVCTYRRPLLLKACLDSLAAQEFPTELCVSVVVVDNEPEGQAREAVERAAATSTVSVRYAHEPRRGIATARNAVLRQALEAGADFVAMIDDDETADSLWIARLMAPGLRQVPIVFGHRRFVYPGGSSFWEKPRKDAIPANGTVPMTATANVRFSRALLDAGLSFNEALNLTGGEDTDFFKRAYALGLKAGYAADAFTYEVVHKERMTYRGLLARHASHFLQEILRRNDRWGEVTRLPYSLFDLVAGGIILLLSPLCILLGKLAFRGAALRGGKHIARGVARILFVVGRTPQYYRQVAGQ